MFPSLIHLMASCLLKSFPGLVHVFARNYTLVWVYPRIIALLESFEAFDQTPGLDPGMVLS